jgi:hypothetical protein
MADFPVYSPWRERIINSGHAPTTKYRVSAGTVNWDRSAMGERVAVWVLMDYDGQANYQMPPHILEEDLPAVLGAITELQVFLRDR